MSRITISFCFTLFISFTAFSQYMDYQVSAPYPVVDAHHKEYYYANDEIMAVKVKGGLVIIQKWNSLTLNEISRKEYKDFGKGFEYEGLREFNGKYYLFYSIWDRGAFNEQLFVREIDFDKGTFKEKGKLLFKVDGKLATAVGRGMGAVYLYGIPLGVKGKFNIQSSSDRSWILIQYRRKPENIRDKKNYDVIGLNAFDDSMNEIYRKEVNMPYTEYKMDNIDYTIDNAGNAHLLALVYDGENRKRFDKEGNVMYHLELFTVLPDSEMLKVVPIEIEGKSITELVMFNTSKGDVLCAGYYSYGSKSNSSVGGVILFKVDMNGDITELKTYDIPLEVVNMFRSDKERAKNEKKSEKGNVEMVEMGIDRLMVYDDGGILLTGEQHFVQQHTRVDAKGRVSHYYTYHYNFIFNARIDGNGEIQWMNKLGKVQVGQRGRGDMSYAYVAGDGHHYYLFLDNIKNADLELNEKPATHADGKGGYFTSYKLNDESGEISKVPTFNMRDVNGLSVSQFGVNRIIPVGPGLFCVEVYKGRKQDVMIKVNADLN